MNSLHINYNRFVDELRIGGEKRATHWCEMCAKVSLDMENLVEGMLKL